MDVADVVAVLESLADGTNPVTGEQLPAQSPYNDPHVIRALYTAARELRQRRMASSGSATRPTKAGQPWLPAEDQQLRQEFAAPLSIPEIARRHHRTRVAILARLVRLGLLARPGSDPSITRANVASAGPQEVAGQRARAGKAWTAEEDADLLRGYDAGQSIEELAARLGRGQNAVDVRLCKLGRGVDNGQGSQPTATDVTSNQISSP